VTVLRADPVQVAAHRGASLHNPENTVVSIRNAIRLGADWVELDVHPIAPDQLPDPAHPGGTITQAHFVLLHDDTFNRTTDVAAKFPGRQNEDASGFTWAEVQRLDAGSWKSKAFAGTPVPDLAMALDAVTEAEAQTGNTVRLMIEYKGSDPAVMQELYRQVKTLRPSWISPTDHDDKVVFSSFEYAAGSGGPSPRGVFDMLRSGPYAADGIEFAGIIDSASDPIPSWLAQVHITNSIASGDMIQLVRAAGIPVIAVWTVNTTASILGAATSGADIVTTNDVATARSVLVR
jgi:glycerophosphoryl diester phosphodiesterase